MAKAKPLTARERKWLLELEEVLSRCPKRLELFTVGDASLEVVDSSEFRAVGEKGFYERTNRDEHECSLGAISSGCKIHGIAG